MTDTPSPKDEAQATAPDAVDPALIEQGRKLFAGSADFIWAAESVASLPPANLLEIAFAGRSNVGKSSLVNALTGRKTLARTSHTPGRTQQLNFFDINGRFTLVDMPGYGFAAVSKTKVEAWTGLIHDYLRGRTKLARVFVLVDSRHGLKDIDKAVMDTLDKTAVSYQVVLTKADEIKATELPALMEATRAALSRRPAAYPEIAVTSSRSGRGIPELRAAVVQLLSERGA